MKFLPDEEETRNKLFDLMAAACKSQNLALPFSILHELAKKDGTDYELDRFIQSIVKTNQDPSLVSEALKQ